MKILVFQIFNASGDILFGEEGLENLRHLMSMGCYGYLTAQDARYSGWLVLARAESSLPSEQEKLLTLWDYLKEAGKNCFLLGTLTEEMAARMQNPAEIQALQAQGLDEFMLLEKILAAQQWDYCQVNYSIAVADLLNPKAYLHFDQELGKTLGMLTEETVLFVMAHFAAGEKPIGFILVSPNNPIVGELATGDTADIAPTLLEMAGYPLPEKTLGRSWVAGLDLADQSASGLTEEEEAILRERLSGLGYI